jgi:hypothetical protein
VPQAVAAASRMNFQRSENIKSVEITQQEVAGRILDILVNDLGLKADDPVPDQQLKLKYRERKGDGADIAKGLKYAGDQEWLYDELTQTWHLTEPGHENA